MKPFTQVQDIGSRITKELTDQLNGLFSEHISDECLQSYIGREFANKYVPWKQKGIKPNAVQLAYEASEWLFWSVLEIGCGVICDGRQIAKDFSEKFSEVNFD